MKKFVFVYYGMKKAGEVEKSAMDKWMSWFGSFKDQMVDGGNPFADEAKSVTAKSVETIKAEDWPAKGYTIINAKDMDEATTIAKKCPVFEDDPKGTVRVYEAMPM